jgi:acetyl esterase
MLIYPATDATCALPSHGTNGAGYLLTRESMAWFMGHYLRSPADAADWRASPLVHPNLAGLPRAFVLTAGFDPLLDEGAAYAAALAAAGTPTSYLCFPSQIHGFVTMGRVLTEANTAVTILAAALAAALDAG